MRQLLPCLPLLFLTGPASAQMVQKCCGSSNSTFLWGFPTASHTQSLFLPSDLSGATSGDIHRLYYRYGTTGIGSGNTLTGVTIRMGLTAQTGFTNGNLFFTGLDTVLTRDTLTIHAGITGDWFSMDLDSLFAYDENLTLIIDINWTTSATTNFGCYGSSNNGRKLHADNDTSATGATSSTTWQDMGFDVMVPTSINDAATLDLHVYPVPASDHLDVRTNELLLWDGLLELRDIMGRSVKTLGFPGNSNRMRVPLADVPRGAYLVSLSDGRGRRRTVPVIVQ